MFLSRLIITRSPRLLCRHKAVPYHRLISFTSSLSNNIDSDLSRKLPKTAKVSKTKKLRRITRESALKNKSRSEDPLEILKAEHNVDVAPCVTITSCEKYDLDEILSSSKVQRLKSLIPNEILHFRYKKKHDVLILEAGSIVGWGIDESTLEKEVIPLFHEYMISPYEFPESEDMDYIEIPDIESESHLIDETIIINSSDRYQSLLDKAAFSSGLSRSTRLAVLENSLERHIATTRKITESLSVGKKLTITEKEVLRLTGRLFLLRGKLNLYSELIEIPDLYWSEPILEKIFRDTSNVLDVSARIAILNSKLDYATEESRALMSTLNEQKGTRLEWIIIYLIMIEVCFETYHFYERYYLDKKDKE